MTDAEFAAWLLRDADRVCLVEMDYIDEEVGEPVTRTKYLSDKPFSGNGNPYDDCINSLPQFSRSLSGTQLGVYQGSLGTIEIDNAEGSNDGMLDLSCDGSEVRFLLGDASWDYSDFRLIFSALSLKVGATSTPRLSVSLKDASVLIDKSIGGNFLVGGTGPNASKARPLNFGFVRQLEALVLDEPTLTYCHSDTGDNTVAYDVRDLGISVGFTDNGDGTFSLEATPDGTVTVDVVSLAAGADPSDYSQRKISDAMFALIGTRAGMDGIGRYYGAHETFAVGDGDDYQIGLSISDQQSCITILGNLVDSGNCFWAINRTGQFTFGRLRPDSAQSLAPPAASIVDDDIMDGSLSIDHAAPTYFQYQAYMDKNWSTPTSLASALTPAQQAALTRNGLYVLQDDGVGDFYADRPELYDLTLVQSPSISTLLSGDPGSDDDADSVILTAWMETRRFMFLPWTETLKCTVGMQFYALELGDVVLVTLPRFGLDAGGYFQVIGINIQMTKGQIDLTLLRRRLSTPYPDGWTRVTTEPDAESSSAIITGAAPTPVSPQSPPAPIVELGPRGAPWYPGAIGSMALGGSASFTPFAPVSAPPVVQLLDNFTGTGDISVHTSDSGHTWAYSNNMFFAGFSPNTSPLALNGSGEVGLSTAGSNKYAAAISSFSPVSADYWVEMRFKRTSAHIVLSAGIAGRYSEATGDGYMVEAYPSDATHANADIQWQWGGGAHSGSDAFGPVTVANGNNFVVRLTMSGSTITVSFDGTVAFTMTDANITAAGGVGFWMNTGSTPYTDLASNYIGTGAA